MSGRIVTDTSPTDKPSGLSPLKRAFLALEQAHARIADLEKAASEPIAVIGLGCRVPGADNVSGFWQMLVNGVDAIAKVPGDRFDIDALYDPDPNAPGRIATRYGGFLRSVDEFDCNFFGIAPREAQGMDPQQRLLLEVVWEALEQAGQAPDQLERSATGVFVGATNSDYRYLENTSGNPGLFDAHYTSGIAHSVLSGRVSYLLGLQGPSLTLDTACSSSLVAVHLACQALRDGDCRMAIAGGVNLMLGSEIFVALSHSHMLAPDGRCKTFAAAADGFSRGEGCGVVVLKRLSDAEADGDRILAVIRSSAVNQDGPSSGLTAPNGPAQEGVIRTALARAGLEPRQIGYIEAHGTGTQLGDPLEMQALGAVFSRDRVPDQPLIVGSVKTNIGHLEAAAGVASLIKLILSLRNQQIPPHLHFDIPNPKIQWDELPIAIPTRPMPWKAIDGRRIGATSSFGFSGTNAHIIVEEAPASSSAKSSPAGVAHLLTFSARDDKALTELAERYVTSFAGRHDDELPDICHTANAGRAQFAWRATITARSIDELATRVSALARGEDSPGLRKNHVERRDPLRVAFLFTGQGAQYAEMARGLYDAFPVFRDALDRCAELVDPHMARPLRDVLFSADSKQLIDDTAFAQPALFAVEYSLAELWRSFGITPNVVAGHSVGEYVAATIAGAFELEDALRLIARRGALMASLPHDGAMAAIFAPEEQVAAVLAPYSDRASVAAVNGPSQTVISGSAPVIKDVCEQFSGRDIQCRPLQVSHAFHSPLMDPILERFENEVAAVKIANPQIRLASNLTGRLAQAGEIQKPDYWRRHLRGAVRFADNLREIAALKPDCVIEIGPQPSLLAFASSVWAAGTATFVPSLRKGRNDREQILDGVATLYLAGAHIDWRGVSGGTGQIVPDLPTYPFQRERCWFEAAAPQFVTAPRSGHPLIGAKVPSAAKATIFEAFLGADNPGFIRHHRVLGQVVLPATAYLEMFLACAREVFDTSAIAISDVTINEAMLLADDGGLRRVQAIYEPASETRTNVTISSLDGDSGRWVRHAAARIEAADPAAQRPAAPTLAEARSRCQNSKTPATLYAELEKRGVEFGEQFRVVRQLWRGGSCAVGEIDLKHNSVEGYHVHPVVLDGSLQVIAGAVMSDSNDTLYLPIGIGRYTLYRSPGTRCFSFVDIGAVKENSLRADIHIFDADGSRIAEISDVQLKRTTRAMLEQHSAESAKAPLYERGWEPAPAAQITDRANPPALIILGDRGGTASALAEALKARGHQHLLYASPEQALSDPQLSSSDRDALHHELCRQWREQFAGEFGVIDLRWLDVSERPPAGGGSFDVVLKDPVSNSLDLVHALLAEFPDRPPRIWSVTRGGQPAGESGVPLSPVQSAAWGLWWSVALEHPEFRSVCIDLDPASDQDEIAALALELEQDGQEQQVAFRGGKRLVARLEPVTAATVKTTKLVEMDCYRLVARERGILDRLEIVDAERRAPNSGEVEIAVTATGLNFRDVLNVLGLYPGEAGPLGGECAGTVVAVGAGVDDLHEGDQVVAMAAGCFASHVIARRELVHRRPSELTSREAAALPIAYLTAGFTLDHVAKLRKGERVLIHAAAGGVGVAAVHIALRAGAEVFATAGSPHKRARLKALGVQHVFDSRSTAFADEILKATAGRGVDVVLNSLSGEFIDASFKAIAAGGRFVEIGKRGIWGADQVNQLGRNIGYHVVDVGTASEQNPELVGKLFANIFEDIDKGILPPLPITSFPIDKSEAAFRHMMQARQIGKIVVSHEAPRIPKLVRTDACYLITGSLSGLGLAVAKWLADQGVRHLALVGRRGLTSEAEPVVADLRSAGVKVTIASLDVSDEAAVATFLQKLRSEGPPLRGIMHAAGVIDDGAVSAQNWDRFSRVLSPKAVGAQILDRLTHKDPLDWFVFFSSAASLLGSAGQCNYVAANTILDVLAHERRRLGRPGQSIDWGLWQGIGLAAGDALQQRVAMQGLNPMSPQQSLGALEEIMSGNLVQVGAIDADWAKFIERRKAQQPISYFSNVLKPLTSRSTSAKPESRQVSLRESLANTSPSRQRVVVKKFVRDCALQVLGQKNSSIVEDITPLGEVGLDSLLAVELRNALSRALGASLPATLLFDYPTVEALTEYLWTEVLASDNKKQAQEQERSADVQTGADLLASIKELSDQEVEGLLSPKLGQVGRRNGRLSATD